MELTDKQKKNIQRAIDSATSSRVKRKSLYLRIIQIIEIDDKK